MKYIHIYYIFIVHKHIYTYLCLHPYRRIYMYLCVYVFLVLHLVLHFGFDAFNFENILPSYFIIYMCAWRWPWGLVLRCWEVLLKNCMCMIWMPNWWPDSSIFLHKFQWPCALELLSDQFPLSNSPTPSSDLQFWLYMHIYTYYAYMYIIYIYIYLYIYDI